MDAERPPTVLMTADTVGGVWTCCVELARALAARGIRVVLATMGAPLREDQRDQVAGIHGLSVKESSWKLEWMEQPWPEVDSAGRWLLALERELRPDLVHLNQFAFGALPFTAPTLLVAHSCVLSWWQAVHGADAPASWNEYRARVGRGLAGADLVAAPTAAMLATLAPNYGFTGTGRVLPNARDAALFRPAPKQDFILAAGRLWDAAKNLAELQAVAPQLPWPVRVAGPTAQPGGRALAARHVQVLGELPAPALAREMALASIYALPARYEPFGLSVLEAALSGCALVLGNIASLREVWGAAALYVAPDDHAALHDTLQWLIAHPQERSRLGAAARARAAQFQPQRMVQSYLEAYAALQPRFGALLEEALPCA